MANEKKKNIDLTGEQLALCHQLVLLNHSLKSFTSAIMAKIDLLLLCNGTRILDNSADDISDLLKVKRVETVTKRVWP